MPTPAQLDELFDHPTIKGKYTLIAETKNVDYRYPPEAMAVVGALDIKSGRIGEALGNTVKDVPPLIHHYTSTANCHEILKSGRLWLTHENFSNDTTEFFHGCDAIGRAIDDFIALKRSEPEVAALERLHKELVRIKDETALFVASFSAGPDKLSQWRGYAPSGVALGFNPSELQHAATKFDWMLYPCSYREDDQKTIARICVEVVLDALGQVPATVAQNTREHVEAILLESTVTTAAPMLKNSSFAEEEEWRLVTPPAHVKREQLVYSVSSRHLVPHVELPIKNDANDHILRSVMLGPPEVPDSAVTGMLWTLSHNKFEGTRVGKSRITYRHL